MAAVDFDPWGRLLQSSRHEFDHPFGVAGLRLDYESGLTHARQRSYQDDLGQFISEDPIGLGGGLNVYAYVFGDPVNQVDPMGECAIPASVIAGVVVGVVFALEISVALAPTISAIALIVNEDQIQNDQFMRQLEKDRRSQAYPGVPQSCPPTPYFENPSNTPMDPFAPWPSIPNAPLQTPVNYNERQQLNQRTFGTVRAGRLR